MCATAGFKKPTDGFKKSADGFKKSADGFKKCGQALSRRTSWTSSAAGTSGPGRPLTAATTVAER
jgi:hypothetical protein